MGKVTPKRTYSPLSKKPQWVWKVIRRGELRTLLPQIRPFMGVRRRAVVDDMIGYLFRNMAQ